MPKRTKNSLAGNRQRQFIFRQVNSILKKEQCENLDKISADESDNSCDFEQRKTLPEQLKQWAIEYGITRRALSALLKILISAGLWYLPSDSRTLLKTPRTVPIIDMCGGKYWHGGLRKHIETLFSGIKQNIGINLSFNVDGLPLFKSSKICFWPILGHVFGLLIISWIFNICTSFIF